MPFCSQCGTFSKAEESDVNITAAPATPARHSKLMHTNEPPVSPESKSIQSVVSRTGTRLTYLEAEISLLKDRLKELEDERSALSEYHAQNTVILSPLRRMPPEVLGEIFSWTVPSLAELVDREESDIECSPWVLTHVSHRWRAIALSTPSLWSLLYISFPRDYPPAMVKTRLERAQKLKIHFFGRQEHDPRLQIEMFKFLSEHSQRWEELSLQLTSDLVPLLDSLRDRLPLLRRLSIQWDGPESQTAVESISCFQTSVSLVDIDIYSEYRFVPTLLPMHRQVTRYDFDAPWETHYELLKSVPNLVEGRIHVYFDDEPWPTPETIDLFYLCRLYVSDVNVLDYLRTPSLEGIALYVPGEGASDIVPHLEPFLKHSTCTLQRFCLEGWEQTL
ncbi:hypothetical protein DFH07DRAFT_793748 [Mycena maculata]|uniref:F-box domain-containing protein n=1 Tax=Mycena maculata TaxID=230809 RepID=A0AAD7NY98_9AGAR|nr:hypothetical protein DFH07DRAFT_793748 [Mycena maculata]